MSEEYNTQPLHRGSGGSMHTRKAHATREPQGVVRDDQPDAREGQAGRTGVAERLVVPLKPGNAQREGRGLSSRPTQDVVRDREIGQPSNSEKCSEAADGFTRESEGGSRLSLLCPVRQDQPRGHSGACLCPVPLEQELTPAEAGARLGSTARILRTSRLMGSSDGWRNWRLPSGRRLTDQSQSDECTYRRPTANSGRWASRPCGIGSA
jgi:hypothetical protein